jgi:hypothetical protein
LADIGEVPAREEVVHDCARPIRWNDRPVRWPMFSAIDRHGWVNVAVALSIRSITTVIASRLEEGERRCGSAGVSDLVDGPLHVRGISPSGNHQQGLRARQDARRRLEELEGMIDAADAYAEAVLDRLDLP